MKAPQPDPELERTARLLAVGVLVFRWVAFAWMVVLAVTRGQPFAHPALAASALAAIGGWTAWLTLARAHDHPFAPVGDLLLATGLVLVSGVVVEERTLLIGTPFFASAYPVAAILVWGAARGPVAGGLVGLVLGAALVAARPLNGVPLGDLGAEQVQGLASSAVIFVTAGIATGVVSRVLARSAEHVRAATERAARLAERESLARRIHDSVLQSLAMIHKRGRELASEGPVAPGQVLHLAELAAEQERELRALVVREAEAAPEGMVSLRAALEREAASHDPAVEVSAVGPIWLPARRAEELAAAVRQGLENVRAHAGASRTTVYAEAEDGWITVSVRDDGRGFTYDEAALRRDGKLGLLASIKGRVEELGGELRVDTAPGRGTELELRVPEEGP